MIIVNSEDTNYVYGTPLYEIFMEQKDYIMNDLWRTSWKRIERITHSIPGVGSALNPETSKDDHYLYFSFPEAKYVFSTKTPARPNEDDYLMLGKFNLSTKTSEVISKLEELPNKYFEAFMSINNNDDLFKMFENNELSVYLMSLDDIGVLISKNTMKNYCLTYKRTYEKISRLMYRYASYGYGYGEKFDSDYKFIKDYHRLALFNFANTRSFEFVPTGLNYEDLLDAREDLMELINEEDGIINLGLSESKINKAVIALIKQQNLMYDLDDDDCDRAALLKEIYKKEFGTIASIFKPLKLK